MQSPSPRICLLFMSDQLSGNVLVVQSGCASSVSNAILSGVISGALNYENIEEIYGSLDGFCGIFNDDLIDLAAQPQQSVRNLLFLPGAALGAFHWVERSKEEIETLFAAFKKHNIRFLFIIGDMEAQSIALELSQTVQEHPHKINIIFIPETINNHFPITDHCLGYGSASKLIATIVCEISAYASAIANHDLINIIEITTNGSDWLIASSMLAQLCNGNSHAPHILLFPSKEFSEEKFLKDVQNVLKSESHCIIVTGESLVNESGNYITHKSMEAAEKLKMIIEESLEVRVLVTKLGSLQYASTHCLSKVDVDEAYESGVKAVDFIMDGINGKMMTILRSETNRYGVEYGIVDLENVLNHKKTFPEHWVNEDGTLNNNFIKYAQPLIQGTIAVTNDNGLPRFSPLKK
ncbi:MAG: diphosphate--fructose-6-phosphate 1-phosphotransferase [Puniceicoccales bacterium]|nr:diphosphate--fructose-6-phosphate 1-phosphotransferase [Puniceicoccales bacterium]